MRYLLGGEQGGRGAGSRLSCERFGSVFPCNLFPWVLSCWPRVWQGVCGWAEPEAAP